ncbi:E3 ubiquitin-protein ligase RLIM-like [Mytilus californianus]|uniref:E3 ubiquitin-protein ligase RLIM-like n=1 Tax=Mytilus californianus TaxID=6549 RepID=UPI002247F01C|nr:E3 ubiquitin-protein ligase RLIM-like [Mytilus californianus]XP_052059183.1 E3 ubiquitin-protein ligase RLIM-like [Mytilus californianus]XP_052059184.1 E3 ubiquitin-protein ligase RLIM-like [Mytilus californianus]XP_052059185.1 E3 ubiquitin-protein ligase RLIM-like [Mytilus californianus]XP_052059186.1 E3 ubiquitin-protein ligase RLIM-like [Mytilus californianus]XP_052059187.1 E3 ubiquitin-protein ligase RLIM-like [Mytilus californianus]XP_052059188.1 E3 ubiquitin-protein ligase RLIM-like 
MDDIDGDFALELQHMELLKPLSSISDNDNERIAWQLQEQDWLEQEQHDADFAQRLVDTDESRHRKRRRCSRNQENENYPSFVNSQLINDAVLAEELQTIELQTPQLQVTYEENEQIALQLQEQEIFEQEQHDANIAQTFEDRNETHKRRQHIGRRYRAPGENRTAQRTHHSRQSTEALNEGSLAGSEVRQQYRSGDNDNQSNRNDYQNYDNDIDDYEALWELQEENGDVQNSGMSEDQIERIPCHKPSLHTSASNEEKQCSICLGEYNVGDYVKALPCFHAYHKECIDQWLKSQAVCPVCRVDIKVE